jgi:hypothetical protein
MKLMEHATQLGKVIGNLLSLEYLLRLYLYDRALITPHEPFPKGFKLEATSVGSGVPHNALTSYDSLKQLIKLYNVYVPAQLKLDESLVNLRDAIAHGRVSAPAKDAPLKLMKFSDPRRGPITVVISEELSPEWFGEQVKRTHAAILKVAQAAGAEVQ